MVDYFVFLAQGIVEGNYAAGIRSAEWWELKREYEMAQRSRERAEEAQMYLSDVINNAIYVGRVAAWDYLLSDVKKSGTRSSEEKALNYVGKFSEEFGVS